MLQDIAPHSLHIEFQNYEAEATDYLVVCSDNRVLIREEGEFPFPTIADARRIYDVKADRMVYLFLLDEKRFFLSLDTLPEAEGLLYQNVRSLRESRLKWLSLVGATAMHLFRWYENNRFCGKCGHPMAFDENERMVYCAACGAMVYPRINPVVIVAVTDGDRLLLTKNANVEYRNLALISGFMEVGETLEETVRREVREEVGLSVGRMRYYKSQPWAFSESLLVGFFAEVKGDTEPFLDGKELTEAIWFDRADLPIDDSSRYSLTRDMIESFRLGEESVTLPTSL